jgi:sulfur relay (sulfurtransferase) complex TusBCD TusD component (DsrE family)
VNALVVINDAPYGSERPYNAFEGARRSTMDELAGWIVWADRTLVF